MKLISFLSLISLLLITSCTSHTYFYSVMEGADPYISKNEKHELIIESDSVDVIYNFHGLNAPIVVGIHNRMSTPIYVDWRKSGVIIDGNVSTFREPIEVYAQWGDTSTVNYARFLNDPEGMSIIKPNQRMNKQVLELANFNFHTIPDSIFGTNPSEIVDSDKLKLKNIRYSADDSPIYLGTFVTIYEEANRTDNTLAFDADFYMSELIQGKKQKPSSLQAYKDKRGDIFYTQRSKDTFWKKAGNTSLQILGKTAVISGNIILWSLGDNLEN